MTRWLAGIGASSLLVLTSATPAGAVPGPRSDQWWFKAWEIQTKIWPITQGSGVTVAVIDNGVNGQLPDLQGALVPGTEVTQGGGNGGGNKGLIGPTSDVEDSHGTGMAGLIASQGTGTGYVGVAPQAKIMPIAANLTNWPQAIRYAADNGAKVINLSQGLASSTGCRPETQQAIAHALERDVVVVASSGNTGSEGNSSMEPANCAGALAVGAVDNQKRAWTNTQRQPYVDVAAPGFLVNSLLADGSVAQRIVGTSQSAALTSGVVALMRSKYPQMSGREVVQRILNTTKDAGPPGKDNQTGLGVIIPLDALNTQVPKSAPNSVYADYDKWKQAHPNAVQGGQKAEKKDVPPSEQTKAADSANRNTMILLVVVGAVIVVGGLVVWLVIRKSKKKAAPMGPGAGFGPQGGQQGPPPGWGGQQAPPLPQQGQQYGPPPQGGPPQPPMQPQGGQPQGPPPQGPGGPPGGQYPPR